MGIPDHRLPRDVLDKEIEIVTNLGVEIKTNTPLGADLTIDNLFEQDYKAVYLALGAHKGIELGIPGEKIGRRPSGGRLFKRIESDRESTGG